MKNIRKKRGFALVECVIAIAVFTIMAMMVAMLINNAIVTHRKNVSETRALRNQRDDIAMFDPKAGSPSLAKRSIDGDLELTFVDADGSDIIADYEFVDWKSNKSEGLEITKFEFDDTGLPTLNGINYKPISLSRVNNTIPPYGGVWDAIVNRHESGIAISSPTCVALGNPGMTNQWGGYTCPGVPVGAFNCTSTNCDNTPLHPNYEAEKVHCTDLKIGIAGVANSNLSAYTIPIGSTIDPSLVIWKADPSLPSTPSDYSFWTANKIDQASINRGAGPVNSSNVTTAELIANMMEVRFNGDIKNTGSTTTDWVRIHVPTDVIGIIIPGDLRYNVWFETNDYTTGGINPGYDSVMYQEKPPPADTGKAIYYDIILEKSAADVRFPPITLALITQKNIQADYPSAGNLKKWLRLGLYCAKIGCNTLGCPLHCLECGDDLVSSECTKMCPDCDAKTHLDSSGACPKGAHCQVMLGGTTTKCKTILDGAGDCPNVAAH